MSNNKMNLDTATPEDVMAEIERLELALKKGMLWPKQTKIYLHRDNDSNWELADELGLSEESSLTFRYTGYEVEVKIEVHQNGMVWATHFQGVELKAKVKI